MASLTSAAGACLCQLDVFEEVEGQHRELGPGASVGRVLDAGVRLVDVETPDLVHQGPLVGGHREPRLILLVHQLFDGRGLGLLERPRVGHLVEVVIALVEAAQQGVGLATRSLDESHHFPSVHVQIVAGVLVEAIKVRLEEPVCEVGYLKKYVHDHMKYRDRRCILT